VKKKKEVLDIIERSHRSFPPYPSPLPNPPRNTALSSSTTWERKKKRVIKRGARRSRRRRRYMNV